MVARHINNTENDDKSRRSSDDIEFTGKLVNFVDRMITILIL